MEYDLRSLPRITNDSYYKEYRNESRYFVMYGGAGSGKSVFATQKIVFRIVTESNHKVLVIRKFGTTMRDSVFALMKETLATFGLLGKCVINKTDMTIRVPMFNSEIVFKSIDDPEKIKSIAGITMMWIEECSELTQQEFQQLDLRLRGETKYAKQIIVSFNPVSIVHWLKDFVDQDMPNKTILHSNYTHNKFIDDEYKRLLESYKGIDEYYYGVYCLGRWGITGKTIFPAQQVSERIMYLKENPALLRRGFFSFEHRTDEPEQIDLRTIKWVDDSSGYVSVYQEPIKGQCYTIGGDTAGEGSDNFTGQVIDIETERQAAVLKHQLDEDLYAQQMFCLGYYYNTALLSVEANFSTYPIKELQRLRYPHQYRREKIDEISLRREYRYGWLTTAKSRPLAIAGLVKVVRENIDSINDLGTLEEMLTFVRDEKGKATAQEGKHDDLIMGLAISHATKHQGYMGAGDGILPDGERVRKHYDFTTELGRDDDDDEEASGRGFFG